MRSKRALTHQDPLDLPNKQDGLFAAFPETVSRMEFVLGKAHSAHMCLFESRKLKKKKKTLVKNVKDYEMS